MARNIQIRTNGDLEITKSGICTVTGMTYASTVTREQYRKWKQGMVIQHAFPGMPAEEREFWISDTTPEEWKKLFPPEEDDE